MTDIGFGAAFVAGLASFLSPCVLPLVPGYLSMISGMSLAELSGKAGRAGPAVPSGAALRSGLASAAFVLGFSAVFVAMGATASALGSAVTAHLGVLTKVAGVVVVVFGLHLAGAFTIPLLYRERRFSMSALRPGYAGAFLMGMAFAFGWSPCIGPILAAILAMAATQESVLRGVALLSVYSLGLGLPFLAAGLAFDRFVGWMARYKPFIRWGEIAAGVLLVALGVMIFFNKTALLTRLVPGGLWRFAR
ncbi:MAG: sulfite exporter TauE/SafE family protein [Elusimicrobia bacterium]|nr:sulfite exporter TauE/SafE family protein [Elusimicrobiota bacterium]